MSAASTHSPFAPSVRVHEVEVCRDAASDSSDPAEQRGCLAAAPILYKHFRKLADLKPAWRNLSGDLPQTQI